MTDDVDQIIRVLALEPHPEGGHYRRIYASQLQVECHGVARPALTAIQFLLCRGERSRWHRVDADETWHWQRGGIVQLQTYDPVSQQLSSLVLGDPKSDHDPALLVVPAGQWQRAWSESAFALVACTVSPGFVWEGFALLDAAPEVERQLHALNATDAAAPVGALPPFPDVPTALTNR